MLETLREIGRHLLRRWWACVLFVTFDISAFIYSPAPWTSDWIKYMLGINAIAAFPAMLWVIHDLRVERDRLRPRAARLKAYARLRRNAERLRRVISNSAFEGDSHTTHHVMDSILGDCASDFGQCAFVIDLEVQLGQFAQDIRDQR